MAKGPHPWELDSLAPETEEVAPHSETQEGTALSSGPMFSGPTEAAAILLISEFPQGHSSIVLKDKAYSQPAFRQLCFFIGVHKSETLSFLCSL